MSKNDRAARRWAAALEEWAIPEEILRTAPEDPWAFPPALFEGFAAQALEADTPSRRRAEEVLEEGDMVLDVGAGAGGASLRLCPPAAGVMAVDSGEGMLGTFGRLAEERGITHREVFGSWPSVAPSVPVADVVVCHHVFYNVPDLAPFALALSSHARRRVVVELSALHPQSGMSPLWRHFHNLDRPTSPTYEDALDVLEEAGLSVEHEVWNRDRPATSSPPSVEFARRRLCLTPDRDEEIAAQLSSPEVAGRPQRVVTVWWTP